MNTFQIPPGVSLHGMKILLTNAQPSLRDLKRYDPRGNWNEVTQLKRLANAMPACNYDEKILTPSDFQTWYSGTNKVDLIWRNMQQEQHGNHTIFTVDVQWAIDNLIVKGPNTAARLIQQQNENVAHTHPSCTDMQHRLIVGWLVAELQGSTMFVSEIQSQLETIRPHVTAKDRFYPLASVCEVLLTEAVRGWLNAGISAIDVVSHTSKSGSFPRDIYSTLLRRNAFTLHSSAWRFGHS